MTTHRSWLNGPWVHTSVGVGIGILATVVVYQLDQAPPRPRYVVDPLRARIVDRAAAPASALTVARSDGRPLTGDVSAATIYFWNDGRKPIRGDQILRTPTVRIGGDASEILEHHVLAASRPDVTDLRLRQVDNRTIAIEGFRILEKGDGIAIQIIYAGNASELIVVDGTLEGVPSLRVCAASPRDRLKMLYVIVPAMLVGFGSAWLEKRVFKFGGNVPRVAGYSVIFGFFCAVAVLAGMAAGWHANPRSKDPVVLVPPMLRKG